MKKINCVAVVIAKVIFSCLFLASCSKDETTKTIIPPEDSVTISSVFPTTAKAGDVLTIYGHNLLKDSLKQKVTINNKNAPIILFSADSLKAIVPLSAGSGRVNIIVGNTSFQGPPIEYTYKVIVTTIAGTGEVGSADGNTAGATFNCPRGIVADVNGDLYIADCYNRLVRKISAATNTVSSITIPVLVGTDNFYSPYNIALDAATHNLYVTDFNAHLMKIWPDGNMAVIYTGPQATAGIAIGADGNLYMANNTLGSILKMDTSGGHQSVFASGLVTPRNIIFDKDNTMFVAGYDQGLSSAVINKIDATGNVSVVNKDKDFEGWEIAVSSNGIFYEADYFGSVIKMIDKNGKITVIAGSGIPDDVDGIGLAASFNHPQSIAIDVQGNLYVTTYNYQEKTGNKVRKITFE